MYLFYIDLITVTIGQKLVFYKLIGFAKGGSC